MSKRTRVYVVVGASAAVAVAAVASVVAFSGGIGPATASSLKGHPPLALDLGLRTDPEAVALRQAGTLYAHGKPADAAKIFDRYHSVDAAVGKALAAWPDGTVDDLGSLAAAHPHSSFVQLHLGFALYWAGRRDQALSAWKDAQRAQPDTYSSIRADDLLH